ncbi:hypothetical protein TCEA9_18620 [Thermobrachium celere]|nr:hypothetical protein TCEA9_18620 [Thermobrachium celere]
MKKIIKVLSTILALTLVFGAFTGCSSKTTNEGSKKNWYGYFYT